MATKKGEPEYSRPNFNAEVNIDSTGEFTWVPKGSACEDAEGIRKMLDAMESMPTARRGVWGKRVDLRATLKACPIIREHPKLAEDLADFAAAYQGPPNHTEETEVRR